MPTRLYFHDAAWTGSGTPPAPITTGPAVGNSTLINNAAGVSTPRVMNETIGTGPHVNVAVATRATTSSQATIYRVFVSAPFAASYTFQTTATSTYYWNVADSETNLNVNHTANLAHVYVYRPSTGAIIGEVGANTISSLMSEPSAASSIQVSESSRTSVAQARSSNFQALEGDVIVVQMAGVFAQGMGTAYSTSFYYDGSTTNATENAVVTNHASYLEFSATLPLAGPATLLGPASGVVSASASATLGSLPGFAAVASVQSTISADLLTTPAFEVQVPIAGAAYPGSVAAVYGMARAEGKTYVSDADGTLRWCYSYVLDDTSLSTPQSAIRNDDYNQGAGSAAGNAAGTVFVSLPAAASQGFGTSRSTDGLTWVRDAGVPGFQLERIHHTNGYFFAVGGVQSSTYRAYSTDGLTWTQFPTPPFTPSRGGFGNGKWVLHTGSAVCTWSSGAGYTTGTSPAGGLGDADAIYFDGQYYVFKKTSSFYHTSADGLTWTSEQLLGAQEFLSVPYVVKNTLFVFVGTQYANPKVLWRRPGGSWNELVLSAADVMDDASALLVGGVDDLAVLVTLRIGGVGGSAANRFFKILPVINDFSAPSGTATCSSTATASLTTQAGTKLYMDGPRLVSSTASGTLTDGPTQWIGALRSRASAVGGGAVIARMAYAAEAPDIITPSGRWVKTRFDGGSTPSGQTSSIYYSDDEGHRWFQATAAPTDSPLSSLCYFSNGSRLFRSAIDSAQILYSDDSGKTWTTASSAGGIASSAIAYGSGRYVRIVEASPNVSLTLEGRVQYSADGASWTVGALLTNADVPSQVSGMSFAAGRNIWWSPEQGKFFAVGLISYYNYPYPTRPVVFSSTDGLTWVQGSELTTTVGSPEYLAMKGGTISTGGHYSTDGGATWTAAQGLPTGTPRGVFLSKGKLFYLCGSGDFSQNTIAFTSTDAITWSPQLLDGASVLFGRTVESPHTYSVDANRVIALSPTEPGTSAYVVTAAPELTATGIQRTVLFGGAAAVSTTSPPTLTLQVTPLFAADAAVSSTASATALIDTDPFLQTLRAAATVLNAALTTSVRMSANLLSRSRPLGGGITEETPFFGIGNTVYAPTTGWVVTPTRRRNPVTGLWSATTPPDGTDAPVLLASDSGSVFCAFSPVGPVTYSSTDGATWTVGSAIPAPPPGWGVMTDFGMTGGNGRFVLYARYGATWYVWVSTNGRTWSAAVSLGTPLGAFDTSLKIIGHTAGFVGVMALTGSAALVASSDGATWSIKTGFTGYADYAGLVGYSAGVVSFACDGGTNTAFLDVSRVMSGSSTTAVLYPAKDANVPGTYWQGDTYSTRPTFYSARSTGFDTLVDPLAPGITHTYTPNRWAKPSLLTLTGDYEVFDDTLYARAIRTSDSAEVGATANIGPALYSSSIALAGSAQAQATLSGALPSIHALAATASGAASASATLLTRQPISASASAVSSATAILQAPVVLAGSAAAVSASAGTLTVGARFIADAAGQATATAALTTSIRLAGALAAQSSAAASAILVPKPLVASATSAVSATAALTVFRPVQAVPKAQATAQAALTTQIRLQANGAAAASADGDLLVGSLMRAAVAGEAIATADLTTEILLGGDLVAAAEATASLMLQVLLDSALTVECLAEGDLTTGVDLRAHVQAVVTTHAILRRFIPVDARKDPLRHLERRSGTVATQFEEGLVHLARGGAVTHTGRDVQAVHTTIDEPLISLTTDEN